jgi:hypothetical protein
MHLIAFDGGSRYLVSFNGDWQAVRGNLDATGQVIDIKLGLRMQPFYLQALLSQGEWYEYPGKPGELEDLLSKTQEPMQSLSTP